MKTRRLTTILTSAYVSAMLASSVAPLRSDSTLAATIDPMTAQKALQNAVSGLDTAGWLAATTGVTPPVAPATPKVAPNTPTPKTDPVMTDELMARLIKFTRTDPAVGSINAKMCSILELCDGTKIMPLAMVKSDRTDIEAYFSMPLSADSKDILILVNTPDIAYVYLTDKTGKLRAAAISDQTSTRLVTNEKAEKRFKDLLAIFAKEAADLPPTGAAVAGNS